MGQDPASATPSAAASLAPGFRFHPTDQELVGYYLRRKVCGKPVRFDAISEIDIYKCEPWDLPGKSRLKSRDLEWYFFSGLDKKYGKTTGRTNRATERGYWKTTGKDRPVLHKSRTVGMKKTLVYHNGRAPTGERTNWVMHEYKLVDEELEKTGYVQDALVLCRVFQKSGTGPKNGEQYGAPFVEEEWDDELVTVPGEEYAEKVAVGDEVYLDGDDLLQILDADTPSDDIPLPLSFYYEDSSSHVQEPLDFDNDGQKLFLGVAGSDCASEQLDGPHLFDLPIQNDVYMNPVRHEYIGEPSNTVNSGDADYMLDDPFLDATDKPISGEGAFLEAHDLSNPVKLGPSGFDMVEDYLTFFDPDENENLVSEQASLSQKQETMGSQQMSQGHENDVASTSKKEPEGLGSDIQHPFLKKTSCMLESIYAPPAFASEFPSKDAAALQLTSTSHSSNSIHITAGIIRIINMTSSSNGAYWSLSKGAEVNIVISFGVSNNDAGLEPKSVSAMSWGRLYLLFLCVLIISMCSKIGSHVYTGKAW